MTEITVNGTAIQEFESLRLTRSLDTLCGQLELACAPRLELISAIKPEQEVVVYEDETPLFTGYVDEVSSHLNADHKGFTVLARDQTSVLVDSSVVRNPMGYKSTTLESMAQDLCQKFGIRVVSQLDQDMAFSPWCLSYGETVFEALERLAKIKGVLLLSSAAGDLVLTRPTIKANITQSITEGEGLYSIHSRFSQKGLYQEYSLTAFSQGMANAVTPIKTLKDPRVTLPKTLIIDSEGLPTSDLAAKRLDYEMGMRRARAAQLTIEVPNWTNGNDSPFELNTLVNLKAPSLGISGQYLISGLEFSLDKASGAITEMTLTLPSAYFADPAAEIRMNAIIDLLRKDWKP